MPKYLNAVHPGGTSDEQNVRGADAILFRDPRQVGRYPLNDPLFRPVGEVSIAFYDETGPII